uniref:Uncharacterized protein n=1 Tax=Chlamydomonas leiostraca TaxID=1034604 RepID=A0A7S0X066_9CHLO
MGPADESGDALRRRAERMELRLRVLRNELVDVCAQQSVVDGRISASEAVEAHLAAQEGEVAARLAAVAAELELVRGACAEQAARTAEARAEAARIAEARTMLTATIEPLEGEVAKLEMLLEGVAEQQAQAAWGILAPGPQHR